MARFDGPIFGAECYPEYWQPLPPNADPGVVEGVRLVERLDLAGDPIPLGAWQAFVPDQQTGDVESLATNPGRSF